MRSVLFFSLASVVAGVSQLALLPHVDAQTSAGVAASLQQPPDSPQAQLYVHAAIAAGAPGPQATQQTSPQSTDQQAANISGTVMDTNGDLIPGVTVVLRGDSTTDSRTVAANDNASFAFGGVKPGVAYHVSISSKDFETWTSPQIVLTPGQFFEVQDIHLKVKVVTSITVYASPVQIATEQVHLEEQQRVLGFIPNFYVVYDSEHAVPLTAKLKFELAWKTSIDPITFAGSAFIAATNQLAHTPDYVLGAKGYGQRFGANYTDNFTGIMFGGVILPVLLRQDPRYYYQGTGTTSSRLKHALAYSFACKGDDGHIQPNYSTIGGDLISSSLSELYYPKSNRGASLVLDNFAIGTAEGALSSVLQEFVVRWFTPSAKKQQH
jgi:hypothetical protein